MASKNETHGAFIRREREAKGLKLREMARQIDVSATFLSKVETENWKPGEDNLRKIANILDCNADELLALAGKVSSDLTDIIRRRPRLMAHLLRGTEGMSGEEVGKLIVSKMKERNVPDLK